MGTIAGTIAAITLGEAGFYGMAQELAQSLRVSANHRYLVKRDGTPFFYLADTAWELFHRLNRSEIDYYLRNRAGKGFTVIQATLLAEDNGLSVPNAEGELPLLNFDPATPNDKYFSLVDYIVDKAAADDLYMALLPTWGSWVDAFTRARESERRLRTSPFVF